MTRGMTSAAILLVIGGAWWIGLREPPPPNEEISEDVWVGKLVDWDCKQRDVEPPCPVNSATAHYALVIDGGIILRLDERGNELTRSAITAARTGGNLAARVDGDRSGRLLEAREVKLIESKDGDDISLLRPVRVVAREI